MQQIDYKVLTRETSWKCDMASKILLLTVRAPKKIKIPRKKSLIKKKENTTTQNLPRQIGHDMAILISCALPHVIVVCGLSATRVTT